VTNYNFLFIIVTILVINNFKFCKLVSKLEILDVNVADQYTFSRLKYKTTDQFVLEAIKSRLKRQISRPKY